MKRRLLFIGDSLTEWYDWARRFPEHDIVNLGVSGEAVEEMLERGDRIRERAGSPDCVFLMTGVNNILGGREAIAGPYREVVRSFLDWWKGAVIVVQSILPVDASWNGNDAVLSANRRLREIAADLGAEYLDVHRVFIGAGGNALPGLLADDGVHLSPRGYEVWAREVETFLRRTPPDEVREGERPS